MILLLDNFDSFTYNLVDYFQQLDTQCMVLRNDVPIEEIRKHHFEGVVLSPGPETPGRAGNLMSVLDYYSTRLPILGICLGHQAIGQLYGATVVKAQRPMHGKICRITTQPDDIFNNIPHQFNVVRYNSLIIDDKSSRISAVAYSHDMEVMAVRHKNLPIWGLQFHPEAALTEYGLDILKNWLSYNHITR